MSGAGISPCPFNVHTLETEHKVMRAMKMKRKTLAIVLSGTLGLAVAGGAYAYWTNSGSGTGTATTGTNAAVTVVQTSIVTAMAPGIAAQALSGTFNNPNAGPVWIKTVVATVTGTEKPVGFPNPTCGADDYTIAGTSVIQGATAGLGAQVPAGAAGTWSGLTIAFNSTAANQDACKDAVVTIGYTTTSTS
jgi:hypothetical protein